MVFIALQLSILIHRSLLVSHLISAFNIGIFKCNNLFLNLYLQDKSDIFLQPSYWGHRKLLQLNRSEEGSNNIIVSQGTFTIHYVILGAVVVLALTMLCYFRSKRFPRIRRRNQSGQETDRVNNNTFDEERVERVATPAAVPLSNVVTLLRTYTYQSFRIARQSPSEKLTTEKTISPPATPTRKSYMAQLLYPHDVSNELRSNSAPEELPEHDVIEIRHYCASLPKFPSDLSENSSPPG